MTNRKASLVAGLLLVALGVAAEPGGRAKYVGGTLPALAHNSSGAIYATDAEFFQFQTHSGTFKVPYQKINLLEYGQKVDRRYMLAVVISPLFLLSKSRRHYVTLGYMDEGGKQQAVVFQVSKGGIRALLASLEARTGLRVTYQDNEARKAGKG